MSNEKVKSLSADPLTVKHVSYQELCLYLEQKDESRDNRFVKVREHIDSCKVCWEIWNQVRWDAAWVKQGLQELKEYLGKNFERYFDSSWALAHDWNLQSPQSKNQIEKFYKTTPYYLYNSVVFYESGDRHNFYKDIKKIIEVKNVKSVTDYGCGVGNDLLMMLKYGIDAYGVDFNSHALNFLRWRLNKRGYDREFIDKHVISLEEDINFPESEMIWTVDVLEHMVDPTEIANAFSEKTKFLVTYIDSSDKAGGRHPFHFDVNFKSFDKFMTSLNFRSIPNKKLHVWEKKG